MVFENKQTVHLMMRMDRRPKCEVIFESALRLDSFNINLSQRLSFNKFPLKKLYAI